MNKVIKLPAPQLSQLKEVNLDTEMNGSHYRLLALHKNDVPEEIILAILKDLVKEDASKLTLNEARYLFMLVKINSLENNYTVDVTCTHDIEKDGVKHRCGCVNKFHVKLSDSDLNPTPRGYEPPKIVIIGYDGTEKKYSVIPPTMDMEVALFNYFITVLNISPDDITKKKESALNYNWMRGLCHLVDNCGKRFVNDFSDFGSLIPLMDKNKFATVVSLNKMVEEVNSYGVQNKVYELKCKECGGRLIFQLPMLHGLTM